jgi:HSP20 family protein
MHGLDVEIDETRHCRPTTAPSAGPTTLVFQGLRGRGWVVEVESMALLRRETKAVEPYDAFGRFDKMFDEWMKALPFRGALEARWPWLAEDMIRVDEYREEGALVVRAELPGIDPEKDVELTVTDGMLHITAERRVEDRQESEKYLRQELRVGSFTRVLPLPEGVTESDITASYKDGILEIRIPLPEPPPAEEPKKIAVTRA